MAPVRILLAEDNPADVYLIEEALREHKVEYALSLAQDGEQVLTLILDAATRPDLLLMDLNMPKRTGGEVLERMRSEPDCAALPVIVLTSSDSPMDRAEAIRLGATMFLRKPTGLDEFLAIGASIKTLLDSNHRDERRDSSNAGQ